MYRLGSTYYLGALVLSYKVVKLLEVLVLWRARTGGRVYTVGIKCFKLLDELTMDIGCDLPFDVVIIVLPVGLQICLEAVIQLFAVHLS